MKAYFVLGATGSVGSAVVARLLSDPQSRVFALVRAASSSAAAGRLDTALAALGVRDRVSTDGGRLHVLVGDVEQPRLGLSTADYNLLSTNCSHIIHCAGVVRMNLPLAAARRATVDAVQNVLEFAQSQKRAGLLKKVEIVSTVGVAGRESRLLREEWVGANHEFHNTYEQAKAEAEQLVHDAVLNGLPVTVHRPSMVVGDSRTGHTLHFQIFYFIVEFLSGRRTRGFFPDFGAARLDIVPVDFVAEAIVRSNQSNITNGKILHLCVGPRGAVPLRRLLAFVHDSLAARGERLPKPRYVSRRLFQMLATGLRLLVDARTRAALATLPIFLDYLDTDQAFDNLRTAAWLKDEGVAIPPIEDYLPRVLDFYFALKRQRPTSEVENEAANAHVHE